MSSPEITVATELSRLIASITSTYPELTDPFDLEWRSPCEIGEPRLHPELGMEIAWKPLPRPANDAEAIFEPLERAVEQPIHPDIKKFYASYYSGGLETDSSEGPVSLLQLWNDEDTERLIENLLGHYLAQQRSKSAFSVFFALTEVDSETFLTVENHTGHVLLERPGYRPIRTVANSLAGFLSSLIPAPPERHPERAAFLRAQKVD